MLFMLYGLEAFQHDELLPRMARWCPRLPRTPDERAPALPPGVRAAPLSACWLCTVGFVPVMNLIEGNAQLSYISPPPRYFHCLAWHIYVAVLRRR